MNKYDLDYVNENKFKKLERAIKKYNMLAFKKLTFDYYPALRNGEFLGKKIDANENDTIEKYELSLPSDKMFTQIHGEVKLIYTVHKKEKVVILETITPEDILLEGHMSELTTYKGIMISKANASKDMFKIDLLNMLQDKHYDDFEDVDDSDDDSDIDYYKLKSNKEYLQEECDKIKKHIDEYLQEECEKMKKYVDEICKERIDNDKKDEVKIDEIENKEEKRDELKTRKDEYRSFITLIIIMLFITILLALIIANL